MRHIIFNQYPDVYLQSVNLHLLRLHHHSNAFMKNENFSQIRPLYVIRPIKFTSYHSDVFLITAILPFTWMEELIVAVFAIRVYFTFMSTLNPKSKQLQGLMLLLLNGAVSCSNFPIILSWQLHFIIVLPIHKIHGHQELYLIFVIS